MNIREQQETQTKAKTEEPDKNNDINIICVGREKYPRQQATQERYNSPISSGIQSRQEDKVKDNECDTQRKKNTDGGKGDNNQMK